MFVAKRITIVGSILFLILVCSFQINASQASSKRPPARARKVIAVRFPLGISESLWRRRIPSDNPLTAQKIALGRALYFDKRLSRDGTVSCATCHDPAFAFTDAKSVAEGTAGGRGTRNAPTILNAVFSDLLFWDGRALSLEEQVKHPLLSAFEMGMSTEPELLTRAGSIPEYGRKFAKVFKSEGLTIATIAKAIAAYERTLLSGNSPFDRFINGNDNAITDAQRRGWELFRGKAGCIDCHKYSADNPFFSDFKFHNTGAAFTESLSGLVRTIAEVSNANSRTDWAHSAGFSELGRFAVTLQSADIGAFRTLTLRDLELTSPYMHEGSFKTLIDVVQFYNRGGNPNAYLDKRIHPLQLSDGEIGDLVQFMRALTSDDVLRQCQTTVRQTRAAVPF
jgi:cytochrome c peroxidase